MELKKQLNSDCVRVPYEVWSIRSLSFQNLDPGSQEIFVVAGSFFFNC